MTGAELELWRLLQNIAVVRRFPERLEWIEQGRRLAAERALGSP